MLDVGLRQQGKHTAARLQQGGIAPAHAIAFGVLILAAIRRYGLLLTRSGQGVESLVRVAPLLHPPLHALGDDVGGLLLDGRLVAEGQTVVIEAQRHLPHPILVGLIGTVAALAGQHAVVGLHLLRLLPLQRSRRLSSLHLQHLLPLVTDGELAILGCH